MTLNYLPTDILHFAVDNGTIDLDTIQCAMDMQNRKNILEQHPYKIWQGQHNNRWYTYLPANNKQKRCLKSYKTRKSLEDAIIKFYQSDALQPCFREIYFEWIAEKEEFDEISPSSICRYRSDFLRFFPANEPFCKIKLCNMEDSYLDRFIKKTIHDKQLSAKSYAGLRTLLLGVFKYAKMKKYTTFSISDFYKDFSLPKNIFKKNIKNKEEEVFSLEEIKLLVSYLSKDLTPQNLAILLQIYTGVRVGELTALKPEDNNKSRYLRICRTEYTYFDTELNKRVTSVKDFPKTDDSIRTIILPKEAQYILNLAMHSAGEYLFSQNGKRITSRQINYALKKACKQIGIFPRSTHKIRRTYASKLLSEHLDDAFVQAQVGHKQITTTQKFYHFDIHSDTQKLALIDKAVNF